MEEMTYLIFCFFIVWYRSFSQSFSIFFQKCFYYVDLFPSATGRLLVLIDFFKSPCLLRFSPGIVCCLFRNVFWFKKFFIHFQNRILLTHYIIGTNKSIWKTSYSRKLLNWIFQCLIWILFSHYSCYN